ncbi:MAG: 2-oxoacid:acceptor oxidoreductase family protein [Candidatus Bathyarchaeota archaeon]|nr:2-oxoacid:acceptor oxidoreductase family protein [Candidatus Bathyarchaeota archaeon]
MTRVEIRICGLGGQGVVLAGQILGRAGVYDGKNVVQTQSYGAEARGSAAKSEVIISDEQIGFPHVRNCDMLVAMSQRGLDAHIKDLKEGGILFIDRDLVKKIPKVKGEIHKLSATEVAQGQLRSKMYANVVMLGALIKETKIVSKEAMEKAIVHTIKSDSAQTNLQALNIGFNL